MSAATGWVVGSWSWRRAPVLYWLANVTQPFLKRVASTCASTDMKVAKLSFSQRSSHQRMVTKSPNHICAISCRIAFARSSRTASVTLERKIIDSLKVTQPMFSMAVPASMEGPGDDRGRVGGHLRRGAKGPTLDVFLARHCLRLTGIVRDHHPITGGDDGESEAGFQVGLIEAGKHPVGIEGLEL